MFFFGPDRAVFSFLLAGEGEELFGDCCRYYLGYLTFLQHLEKSEKLACHHLS